MCFGMMDPTVQADFNNINTMNPADKTDYMKRLVLGGFATGFGDKVRKAQLGSSVSPKSLGTVIPDTNLQALK